MSEPVSVLVVHYSSAQLAKLPMYVRTATVTDNRPGGHHCIVKYFFSCCIKPLWTASTE